MSINTIYPVVNPRLGASFAIFTSAFVCLILMLVILEQLGMSRDVIGQIVIVVPVLFYLAIGVLARTITADDFFISGQRVPAFYNGLSLSANCLGATAILSLTGALFFSGIDALAIGAGLCGGLALIAVLFSSHLRKAGAYTLPGFMGLRFGSRIVRFAAAVLLVGPCMLLLVAEIKLGAMAASFFFPRISQSLLMAIGAALAASTVVLGGMRSLTWSQCAQSIVTLLGVAIPVIAVSVMLTNLPLPQLTYGYILQAVSELEVAKGLIASVAQPEPLSAALPGPDFEALTIPFMKLFTTISVTDFILLSLCVMLGGAVLPIQIARLSTTPSVSTVRKSLGWGVLLVGLMVVTLPAYAVFVKYFVAQDLSGQPLTEIPNWGQVAKSFGMLTISSEQLNSALGESETKLRRDAITLLLPLAAKLPYALLGVAAAAAIAAALAAAAGQMIAIGNAFSNDIYYNAVSRSASPSRRLLIARAAIAATAAAGLWLAAQLPVDPLKLALWALSLSAATFFPIMLLSVWWARTGAAAALFGMGAGFAVTMLCIVMGQAGGPGLLGVDSLIAGAIGVPIGILVIVVMTMMAPAADDETKEFVEEMRLSSGETLFARSLRLASRGRASRS